MYSVIYPLVVTPPGVYSSKNTTHIPPSMLTGTPFSRLAIGQHSKVFSRLLNKLDILLIVRICADRPDTPFLSYRATSTIWGDIESGDSFRFNRGIPHHTPMEVVVESTLTDPWRKSKSISLDRPQHGTRRSAKIDVCPCFLLSEVE